MSASSPAPEPNESEQPPYDGKPLQFSFEQLEKFGKALVLMIAVVYALGLVVTNQYLMHYGISDFGSLRPKYILTGTWVAWLICLAGFPPAVAVTKFRSFQGSKWLPTMIWSVFALLVSALLFYLTADLLSVATLKAWVSLGLLTVATFLVAVPYMSFTRDEPAQSQDPISIALTVSLFLLIAGPFLHQLSGPAFYARIPEALGGGRPANATLILNSQGVIIWQQAGMPIAPKTSLNTDKIEIIYQDDHNLYVVGSYQDQKTTKKKLVVINRSLVDAILPESD